MGAAKLPSFSTAAGALEPSKSAVNDTAKSYSKRLLKHLLLKHLLLKHLLLNAI